MKHEIKIVIDGKESRIVSPEYNCADVEAKKSIIAGICAYGARIINSGLSPETTPVIIRETLPNGSRRARFDLDPETGKRKMLA